MDEQTKSLSTSPESIFSQYSSHGTAESGGIIPTMSALSVLSPLRTSITLANMTNLTNAPENRNLFFDDFNSPRSSTLSRWQSDAENLSLSFNQSSQQSSASANYLINEFLANYNNSSSSITDTIVSPMSQMSTSSSIMSLSSIGNPKPISQRSSRSAAEQIPSASSLSNRPMLSSIDNDLQRVPPSYMFMQPLTNYGTSSISQSKSQPQIIHNTGRSTTMPSWRGQLPIKFEPITIDQYHTTTSYSQKVFLGGIPNELSEAELLLVLRRFGRCNIKWPKNEGIKQNMPSFCHVVYRESRSVCELLKHCTRQQRTTIDYFLHIHITPSLLSTTNSSLRSLRSKPIQVVPWNTKDNVYAVPHKTITNNEVPYQDWSRTIFVSPLHGKMTAFSLSSIMSEVFGTVLMAQINTDKYGYPTGTGTVLFSDSHSYMRAVAAGVIDIKCDCFHKLLDIDPFLRENEPCAYCPSVADAFCRNFHCLRSYCKQCWINRHGPKPLADHLPATRRQQPLLQFSIENM